MSLDVLPGSASQPGEHELRAAPHRGATTQEVNHWRNRAKPQQGRASAADSTDCEISEHWVDRTVVVSVAGVVDMLTARRLEEAIRAGLAKEPVGLVVDFTAVEFLASAGMGILVAVHDEISLPASDVCVVAEGPATSRP